jgi:cell division protein FtsL
MNVKISKSGESASRGAGKASIFSMGKVSSSGPGRGGAFLMAGLAAIVLFVGLFYVWSRMRLVQIGYEITELERINNDLKKRKRELKLELASLEAPANLESKARTEAGLIFPPIKKVVHVP